MRTRGTIRALLALMAELIVGSAPVAAAPIAAAAGLDFCVPGQSPHFAFGFADLRAQLGSVMGDAAECEHPNASNGDTLQKTSRGLAFYRKSTNTPTFTDGSTHWALTAAAGLVSWQGTSVDPPSNAALPAPTQPTAPETPQLLLDGQAPDLCQAGTYSPQFTYCVYPNNNVAEWAHPSSGWVFNGYYDGAIWRYTPDGVAAHPDAVAPAPAPVPVPAPLPAPAPSSAPAPILTAGVSFASIDGSASLVAQDGQYLGLLTSHSWETKGICTSWGDYGSTWSSTSIHTTWGTYGSTWSDLSPYNTWSTKPPTIIYQGKALAYVSKNTALRGIDPDLLLTAYGCSK